MSDINDLTSPSPKINDAGLLPKQIIACFHSLRPQFSAKCLKNTQGYTQYCVDFQIKNHNQKFLLIVRQKRIQQQTESEQFQLDLKFLVHLLSPRIRQILQNVSKIQLLCVLKEANINNLQGYQIYPQQCQSQCENLFFVRKKLTTLSYQTISLYLKQIAFLYEIVLNQLQKLFFYRRKCIKDVRFRLKQMREGFIQYRQNRYRMNGRLVCKNFLSYQVKKEKVQKQEQQKNRQQFILKTKEQRNQIDRSSKKQQNDNNATSILRTIQFIKKYKEKKVHTSYYSILTKLKAVFRNFDTLIFFRDEYLQEGGGTILQTYQQYGQFTKKDIACKQIISNSLQQKSQKSAQASLRNQKEFLMGVQSQKCMHIGRFYFDLKDGQDITNKNAKIYLDWQEKDLQSFIQNNQRLTLDDYLNFAIQILKGLHFMQQMGYVYRDLKLANVLVSKNMILRLIDFGSVYPSHLQQQDFYYKMKCQKFDPTPRLTPNYAMTLNMAKQKYPNLIKKYTSASYNRHKLFDMFAFGKVFKQFVLNLKPKNFNMLDEQVKQNLSFIIKNCTQFDPENRMNHDELMIFIQKLQQYRQIQKRVQQNFFY